MRIGIDLGGTKIEGIVLGPGGQERARHRVPTPRGNYEGIVDAVVGLVRKLEGEVDGAASASASVGIGIPGTISSVTGLVKNANTTELIGHPLDGDLARRLGRPVRVANDANCFALSEATDGAGMPPQNRNSSDPWVVFGVIIGTGTGGGIVVDGRVLVGPNSIAGEWGHNGLPWPGSNGWTDELPGPSCYCGKRGCLETFVSGPGIARDHKDRTGQALSPDEIAKLADEQDAEAVRTMARLDDRLARGLAALMNVLDPDVVVLGGGVSNIARIYENVPKIWGRYVFSDTVGTQLVRARHGDSSGVRGAAWLWPGS